MKGNDRAAVLNVLKDELAFLEHGGYREPSRNPWKASSIFLDSPTCINRGDPKRSRACTECPLMEFVPPEGREATFPCHHIPLTQSGDTVNSVERWGDQNELEEIVKSWLEMKIQEMELQVLESKRPRGR